LRNRAAAFSPYSKPADLWFGEEQSKADKVGRERKGEQRRGNVGIGRTVGFCTSFFIPPFAEVSPSFLCKNYDVAFYQEKQILQKACH